jgi:hypothetical protein
VDPKNKIKESQRDRKEKIHDFVWPKEKFLNIRSINGYEE